MKKRIAILACIAIIMGVYAVPAFASDDNYSFDLDLGGGHRNDYTTYKYRETKRDANEWKVNMRYNEEGKGTKATYWLVDATSYERLTNTYTIAQGSGANYFWGSWNANENWVRMGAENNNDTVFAVTVKGYWDEETW